ncbi:hypothetical protein TrCOL_g2506 [Triparma columacea]|uniref:Cilia- and flagella-associated protein 36 n=1 Tax=Triparma columacea TaxID=722753 RepID=A0A9W7LDK8_9STRA|nr:hypothetical protein TrCOL_g2506 [Triparma columacea]
MSSTPPPEDADLQISALSQFLTSPLFLTPISNFIDTHCATFEDTSEYSPGHHGVFLEFRDLVDNLLTDVLKSLHIPPASLLSSLTHPDFKSTPRVVGVVDTLRGTDDFVVFFDNMVARNRQIEMEEQTQPVDDGGKNKTREDEIVGAPGNGDVGDGVVYHDDNEGGSGSPVDGPSWDLQVAKAASLLSSTTPNDLSSNLMLPWAEAVMSVRREMDTPGLSESRKQRILTELAGHKLRVDFIVVQRHANDRREKLNTQLFQNLTQAGRLNFLLNELHNLRSEVAEARGKAVNYGCGSVGSEALNLVYFYLKDIVNSGRLPAEEVDSIIPFTRLHVRKEDDEIVVLVFKWIELEGIIDDVQKKIQRMLDKPEEEVVEEREVKDVVREKVEDIKSNLMGEEEGGGMQEDAGGEEVSGLVSDDDEGEGIADANATGTDEYNEYNEHNEHNNEHNQDDDDGTQSHHALQWIEQYDSSSGYNFYYNQVTQETQWDPPEGEAYIPVSLDALGYEMVEEEGGGGGEKGDEYAEWEWDEDRGQWVYKGEEEHKEGGEDEGEEKREEGGPAAALKSAEDADDDDEMGGPLTLKIVDVTDQEIAEIAQTSLVVEQPTGDEQQPSPSPSSKKKKKKKKKKKFVVRAKSSPPPPSVPFYLTESMTPKQRRQMEDMLLGGEGVATTAEADVKNPLLKGGAGGAGRRSAEKKKQRMVQMAQAKGAKKSSSGRETKQEAEGEAPPVAEEKNNDEEASTKPPAFPPPMAPSPAPTSPAILPPTGLPSLRTMQARRKSSLPPIEALKGDLV